MRMTGYGVTGSTHDFFAYNSDGDVWNGAAFVAWSDVDFATYRIASTVTATIGGESRFEADAPGGTVRYELRFRGATAALSYLAWEGEVGIGDFITVTTSISTTSYALKADVQAWNGLENAVRTINVYSRDPGGPPVGGGDAVPYVGADVSRFGGVGADYFVHEDVVAQTVEFHSHVHGMTEDSGIASQASVDAIPKYGDTQRWTNTSTSETHDITVEEVP